MQIAKEHIRQNILNAALPLFYAKGYSKVTIREIADDSHVGLSNIYNYYNSKEDIFRELVQPVINDFEIMLDKHHGKSGSDIMEMYFNKSGTYPVKTIGENTFPVNLPSLISLAMSTKHWIPQFFGSSMPLLAFSR